MASVSLSLTVDQATVNNPNNVVTGTNAPGVGAIEVRVDMAQFTTLTQIRLALDQIEFFLADENLGPNAFKVL